MINGNVTNKKSLTEHAIEGMVRAELALQDLAQEYEAAFDEIVRLKADLQIAMELLRAHSQPPDWMLTEPKLAEDWNIKWGRLLIKAKGCTP